MLRNPRFWIPAASLTAVGWLLYVDLGRTSPGPITQTHAQAPELLGSASCEICHGGFAVSLDEACSGCHAEIGEDLETGTGLHGTLDGADPKDCGLCHDEHLGADFRLVSENSFVLAGLESREAFDHAAVDFTLEGTHAELGCVECHLNADLLLIPQGERRFLGLERTCVACHEDVHEGRIVRDCADCHGQAHPFSEVATFAHARFVADGAHAQASCEDCHAPESERSVEMLAGPDPPRKKLTCVECHESPHSRPFLVAVGELTSSRPRDSCSLCHAAVHEDFAGRGDAMPTELHPASGFALDAPHDDVGCAECHLPAQGGGAYAFAGSYPGRKADECATCHADVHAGQFVGGPFASCLDCHTRHAFSPSAFDIDHHAQTNFELAGSHAAVTCSACHLEPESDEPLVFAEAPSSCADCHADAHRGAFSASCDSCHGVDLFAEFHAEAFDHGQLTAFALDGAHARADCDACHRSAEAPDRAGRTFGFVDEVFGTPVDACATCHDDPHRGAFEDRGGCVSCHTTEAFYDLELDVFDHELWTGYELEGAHARAQCTACHPRAQQPDELGRTLGRVDEVFGRPVDACATCHADPHRGAFDSPERPPAVAGRTGCARCHTTESFAELWSGPFDHGRWTGYRLDSDHIALDCTACHARSTVDDGYSPLGPAAGTSCSDCHADPHVGQFAQAGRTDCARCHRDAGGLSFDHERDARFALDEAHEKLACAECHMPWPLPDGGAAVRYKPLGIECTDCHGPRGGGR